MTPIGAPGPKQLGGFIQELSGFAANAERNLNEISESDGLSEARLAEFSEQMIAIRGTADQLGFPRISRIAGLGEEIAVKAAVITRRSQLRRYLTSLWDALTTVKFMLENLDQETSEEQEILIHRLQTVLTQLGGPRSTVDQSEIERLLGERSGD